jgi:hypothetical protein
MLAYLMRTLRDRDHINSELGTQAGFLPGRSALLNCFALHHMVHHQRFVAKQPLYAVLMDVKGAYDTVRYDTLLETLMDRFVLPPDMVAPLIGMYAGLQYAVLYGGMADHPLAVGVGVKQGCPLSPVLYALYVSGLTAHLQATCLDVGYVLPGYRLHDLFYADDLVLVEGSADPGGLQRSVESSLVHMRGINQRENVAKCLAVVMGAHEGAAALQLQISGVPVAQSEEAKYLGLMFDREASATTMMQRRVQVYTSQFYAVLSDLRQAADCIPNTILVTLKLLRVRAESAGLWGCGLWGVFHLHNHLNGPHRWDRFYQLTDPMEMRRCQLLRQYLKLPRHIPKLCLLHELGLQPFVHTYVLRAVGLYNLLLKAGPVFHALLQQQVHDGLVLRVPNWVHHLHRALCMLLPRGQWMRYMRPTQGQPQPIKVQDVRKALREGYAAYVTTLASVQGGEGEGSRRGVYFRMVSHTMGHQPRYLGVHLSPVVVRACLRFRLGAHHLEVTNHAVAYGHRVCQRCPHHQGGVDTEAHCLLHCADADIVAARTQLQQSVFPAGMPSTVKGLFSPPDSGWGAVRRVVLYVMQCGRIVDARRAAAAQPVPPLEFEPIVDILLDMFDSSDEEALGVVTSDEEELVQMVGL